MTDVVKMSDLISRADAVKVKNMKMPTACENCLLSNWTSTRTWKCVPQDRKYSEHKGDNGNIRQEDCPLIGEVADRPTGEGIPCSERKAR